VTRIRTLQQKGVIQPWRLVKSLFL
jgi:hypothetical protein